MALNVCMASPNIRMHWCSVMLPNSTWVYPSLKHKHPSLPSMLHKIHLSCLQKTLPAASTYGAQRWQSRRQRFLAACEAILKPLVPYEKNVPLWDPMIVGKL